MNKPELFEELFLNGDDSHGELEPEIDSTSSVKLPRIGSKPVADHDALGSRVKVRCQIKHGDLLVSKYVDMVDGHMHAQLSIQGGMTDRRLHFRLRVGSPVRDGSNSDPMADTADSKTRSGWTDNNIESTTDRFVHFVVPLDKDHSITAVKVEKIEGTQSVEDSACTNWTCDLHLTSNIDAILFGGAFPQSIEDTEFQQAVVALREQLNKREWCFKLHWVTLVVEESDHLPAGSTISNGTPVLPRYLTQFIEGLHRPISTSAFSAYCDKEGRARIKWNAQPDRDKIYQSTPYQRHPRSMGFKTLTEAAIKLAVPPYTDSHVIRSKLNEVNNKNFRSVTFHRHDPGEVVAFVGANVKVFLDDNDILSDFAQKKSRHLQHSHSAAYQRRS